MLYIGLRNGGVNRVYIDNPFPIELRGSKKESKSTVVVSVSVNVLRTMCGIVDSNKKLSVVDLSTQNTLYTAEDVTCVYFNTEVNDMLCHANEDHVIVVSGTSIVQ
jgi:hypothetical protein